MTNRIFEKSKSITHYCISDYPDIDLSLVGNHTVEAMAVEVIDSGTFDDPRAGRQPCSRRIEAPHVRMDCARPLGCSERLPGADEEVV